MACGQEHQSSSGSPENAIHHIGPHRPQSACYEAARVAGVSGLPPPQRYPGRSGESGTKDTLAALPHEERTPYDTDTTTAWPVLWGIVELPGFRITVGLRQRISVTVYDYDNDLHFYLFRCSAMDVRHFPSAPLAFSDSRRALAGQARRLSLARRGLSPHASKNTRLLSSMLSRGSTSAGVVGSSKAECGAKRALPSSAES